MRTDIRDYDTESTLSFLVSCRFAIRLIMPRPKAAEFEGGRFSLHHELQTVLRLATSPEPELEMSEWAGTASNCTAWEQCFNSNGTMLCSCFCKERAAGRHPLSPSSGRYLYKRILVCAPNFCRLATYIMKINIMQTT
ncbi:hypothetical protein FKM82_010865 [Ascaphus truei]